MSNYLCPFCNQHQATTGPKRDRQVLKFHVEDNAEGPFGVEFMILSCANPDCRKSTVEIGIGAVYRQLGHTYEIDYSKPLLTARRLIPSGQAKNYPDYIPAPLLEDYREACLIKDISPKAAATLVRRCLQGMIRNFCGISLHRLVDEIAALKKLLNEGKAPNGVSLETIEAIDHVRSVGNIGAHMERDIGLIVPVEPEEADTLIKLVELLFEEWYIARHKRTERLAAIKTVSLDKAKIKTGEIMAEPFSAAKPAQDITE